MLFFSERNTVPELMDDFEMPREELEINLKELETINKWLGGYSVSFSGLSRLKIQAGKEIRLVDVGCGGGDGMIAMQKFLEKRGIKARMIGVDANQKVLDYARKRCVRHPDFEWICLPFQEVRDLDADVYHCSLFAHHFYGADLEALFGLFKSARVGFVINDLHRQFLAYQGISLLTRLFSKSYLVRNDARLSVSKGFSRRELEGLCRKAGIYDFELEWKWAFRWQLSSITGHDN